MNELKHPCASKCPEYKDEQCNHCLVKVNCHQSRWVHVLSMSLNFAMAILSFKK
jgi:hypothetical protein